MASRLNVVLLIAGFALPLQAQRATNAVASAPTRKAPASMYTGLKTKQHMSVQGAQRKLSDYPSVISVDKGSPAALAGFLVGDLLVEVNGFDTIKQPDRAILRGPALPTTVRVRRGIMDVVLVITPAKRGTPTS